MSRSHNRNSKRSASVLALRDLEARLAPLDRYGLDGFSSAIADGLRAFHSVMRSKICGVALTIGVCGRVC